MIINDLNLDIQLFIGDLSPNNIKSHKIGMIQSLTFINHNMTIFLKLNDNKNEILFINYLNNNYLESEFIRLIQLKAFI